MTQWPPYCDYFLTPLPPPPAAAMKEPLSVLPPFLLSLLQAYTHPEMVDGGQYRKGEGRAGGRQGEAHPTAEPVG